MASPAPIKAAPLHPDDWILAAFARLSSEGVDAVRVEVLARDLGVSKGSFYWHFQDREELLAKLLARWDEAEMNWLHVASAGTQSAAARWALFLERSADPERARLEVAIRNWARRDPNVAGRTSVIEKKKAEFIEGVLRDTGFASGAAEYWSQIVQLACLGWLDRATRNAEGHSPVPSLGELLSELVLAASARSATSIH